MTFRRRLLYRLNLSGWLVVACAIGLWQLLVDVGILQYQFLPAPSEVARAIWDSLVSGDLAADIGHTLLVALIASAIAMPLGVAVGISIGLVPLFRGYSMASFDFLRTLPVTAMIPAALLLWGPTANTEIIVATYAAIWPMLINAAGGVAAVHPRLYDVAQTFRFSRWRTVRKVVIPAATPAILVGGRLAVVSALVVAVVAEILVNPKGLGWGLIQAQNALQPARMWGYAVVIGIIGYLLNALLVRAVRLALPGGGAGAGATEAGA